MDPLRKVLTGTALVVLLLGGTITPVAAGSDDHHGDGYGDAHVGDDGREGGDGRRYEYHRSGRDGDQDDYRYAHDHDDGTDWDDDGTDSRDEREDHWYSCEKHGRWHWVDHDDTVSREHHDRMDVEGEHQHEKGRDHHHEHQY